MPHSHGNLDKALGRSWMSTYSSFIPESDLKSHFDSYYAKASLLSMFDNPCIKGFIAEMDDHIAGVARLFLNRDENRLYIPSMYFLPEFQGHGMGRQLLEAAEKYAAEKSLDELWIGVMVISICQGRTFPHGEYDGEPPHRLQEIRREHFLSSNVLCAL